MKTFILISLALVGCFCQVYQATLNHRDVTHEINRVRSQIAEESEIANMNQMVYDKALESFVISALEEYGCPDEKVWKLGDLEVIPVNAKSELAQASADPGRTRFAFFNHSCSGMLFVFDTNPSFSPINGAPGSKCPGKRQVNGLCGSKRGYARKKVDAQDVKNIIHFLQYQTHQMNPTIFLGLALLGLSSIAIEAKQYITRGKALKEVNDARSRYANESQIGNMNELVYDWKLESIAKKEVEKHKGCIENTMTTVDGNLQLFKLHILLLLFPDADETVDYLISKPGRTKMAFVIAKCKDDQEYEDIHLILDTDSNIPILSGKPGSRCPQNRPFNNNGLCGTSKGYVRKGRVNKSDVQKFAKWISYER
ncbi:unnamed protein product [Caenorhabditis brenneri]